jgi:hypothetical protein
MQNRKQWRMVLMLKSYTKPRQLGHRDAIHIFDSEVIIEEKIDGSQISFGRDGAGVLFMRSHHKPIDIDNPPKMFALAVEMVKMVKDDLPLGHTFRGEYLNKPKHNVLAYNRVPRQNIMIFDIDVGDCAYMHPNPKRNLAERLGFECVPLLFQGVVQDRVKLVSLLELTSVLGGQQIEGFVVKNYKMRDSDDHTLMAKYVSDKFKEVAGSEFKHAGNKDKVAVLIAKYGSEARWNKAVQHLTEQDKLSHEPKDIGLLIPEVVRDTLDECEDEIKAHLYALFLKDIRKGLVRGLPEWYKAQLMQGMDHAVHNAAYTAEQKRALEDVR